MFRLGILPHRMIVRLMIAAALIGLSFLLQTAFGESPRLPLGQPARPTPPELSAPPSAAAIPRSVVVVSDKEKPRDLPVPAAGSVRTGPPQDSALPTGSPYPPAATGNRYASEATSNRYAAPTSSVSEAGPVPGFAAPKSVSVLAPHSTVTDSQAPAPAGVTSPTELPLTFEENRLDGPAQPIHQNKPVGVNPANTGRSVLSPAAGPTYNPPSSAATPLNNQPEEPATAYPRTTIATDDGPTLDATTEQGAPIEPSDAPVGDAPLPTPHTPSATAAASAEASHVARSEIVPSTFRDVEPGVTTLDQVVAAWGKPLEQTGTAGEANLFYKIAPFSGVQVHASQGVVTSIMIQLDSSLAPGPLAERLQLDFIRTVEVRNEQGQSLGRAFPERGVLFSYDPAAPEPLVAQVLLETIDSQAFYLRAETLWRTQAAASLDDLNYVIEHSSGDAEAHHLLARIHLSLGQIDEALAAVDKALQLDSTENDYRLTRAQCLSQLGNDQAAEQEALAVQSAEGVTTLAKSRALLLLGDLLAAGTRRDFKAAIGLHMEAIKLAEPLAADPLVATRRKAKEVLIAATLAVARDIAWGNWNRKEEVVPKWIERGDAYARDAIAHDGAGVELRLKVIEGALAAHAGFKPAVDPTRFLEVADQLTKRLVDSTQDPLAQQAAEWELGRIYNHGVRLAHLRGTVDAGFKYGAIAQEKLEYAASGRGSSVLARNELGRLYFHLGVLEAVHKQDHAKAVEWYDRAHDLLLAEENHKVEDPGQLGEMLVSMGVSYWQVDQKQQALALTTQGTKFVEEAVRQGILAADSLTVPYGNLASMHTELGNTEKAREINLIAEKLQRSQIK